MENFLDYEPEIWNCAPILKSSNCYQYMLNYIDLDRINDCHKKLKDGEANCGQIGISCKDEKCKSIENQCERYKYAIINDTLTNKDIYEIEKQETCPTGYYKGVLLFAPLKKNEDKSGYHFMREDTLNNWSHKFAYGKATNKDLSDKKITYPLNADLDYNYNPDPYSNYSELCGTFCIEESDISNEIRNKLNNHAFCNPK
jgi:hypothetical protein